MYLVDAKEFDDQNQDGAYVDSSRFSWQQRVAFTGAVLQASDDAARNALNGELSVLIVKQLKGTGVHATGSKSHNLYAHHTLESDGCESRPAAPRTVHRSLGASYARISVMPAAARR